MEGLPMLTCLIQHTLRCLCTCSSSDSSSDSKWAYAVFWRIVPRIYPPPKWDYGGGVLDRAKGNKQNWILVWEDGYCDFHECEQRRNGYLKGRFGADIFFKLSHEVYNYGEGLIGKVAADNSHKWVFRDSSSEHDPSFISSWNASIDPQPRAWGFHFNSGIQTIAIISVREGIIQLGSFDKVLEDLNLVISIQRKFSYLQSIPGTYAMQRPFFTVQHGYNTLKHNSFLGGGGTMGSNEAFGTEDDNKAQQLIGFERGMINILGGDGPPTKGPIKSVNLGYSTPENGLLGSCGPPFWPIPSLLPPSSFGSLLPKLPLCQNGEDPIDQTRITNGYNKQRVGGNVTQVMDPGQKGKLGCVSYNLNPNSEMMVELGFGPVSDTKESEVK